MPRRAWTIKPPVGVGVNRGHALAGGLIRAWFFAEGGGQLVTEGVIQDPTTMTTPGSFSWVAGRDGIALASTGASGTWLQGTRVPVLSNGFTYAVRIRMDTLQTFRRWINFPAAGPAYLSTDGGDSSKVDFLIQTSGGNYQVLSPTGLIVAGEWATWVGTWDRGTLRLYKNGVEVVNGATTGTLNALTDAFQLFGRSGNVGDSLTAAMSWVTVWDRPLTPDEVRQLTVDPYVLLMAPTWRITGSPPNTIAVPVAAITAAALAPTNRLTAQAPVAAATVAAPTPAVRAVVGAPVAALSGAALAPTTRLVVSVPIAAVSVAALPPAAYTYTPVAAVSVAAQAPTVTARVPAPIAAVSGAALVPTTRLVVSVPVASIAVAALTPTIVGPGELVFVPVAAVTVSGQAPTILARVPVPIAAIGVDALAPSLRLVVDVPIVAVSAAALDPEIVLIGRPLVFHRPQFHPLVSTSFVGIGRRGIVSPIRTRSRITSRVAGVSGVIDE